MRSPPTAPSVVTTATAGTRGRPVRGDVRAHAAPDLHQQCRAAATCTGGRPTRRPPDREDSHERQPSSGVSFTHDARGAGCDGRRHLGPVRVLVLTAEPVTLAASETLCWVGSAVAHVGTEDGRAPVAVALLLADVLASAALARAHAGQDRR